jgi:hypothetical protein
MHAYTETKRTLTVCSHAAREGPGRATVSELPLHIIHGRGAHRAAEKDAGVNLIVYIFASQTWALGVCPSQKEIDDTFFQTRLRMWGVGHSAWDHDVPDPSCVCAWVLTFCSLRQ